MANEFLGWAQDDFDDKITIQRVADTDYTQIQFWMNSDRVDVKTLLADEERSSPPSAFMTFMPDELLDFAKTLAEVAREQATYGSKLEQGEADRDLCFQPIKETAHYFSYCGRVIAQVRDKKETELLLSMLQNHLATYDA